MLKTMHGLGLKTSVQNFDTFVGCMLMGNQPWPQFQNGIRERSIVQLQSNLSNGTDKLYFLLVQNSY